MDISDLLSQEEPEYKHVVNDNGLDSLHITEYAFKKACAYARLAVKKASCQIECGGYLITPKDSKDRIARDAFLARGQDVSAGLYTLNAEDVIKAGREIDTSGHKVLGWWHSHGNMQTFFSSTDDNGQLTVLNEISAINYIVQQTQKYVGNLEVRIEDGVIVMFDKKNPDRTYEAEFKGDASQISIANLNFKQNKRIGFAYGLVVNAHDGKNGEPYAEIATRDFCSSCRDSRDKSVIVDVELIEEGEFSIDEGALMEEIKDKVNMNPPYKFWKRKRRRSTVYFPNGVSDDNFVGVHGESGAGYQTAEFGGTFPSRYPSLYNNSFSSQVPILPVAPILLIPQTNNPPITPPKDNVPKPKKEKSIKESKKYSKGEITKENEKP